MVVPVAMVVPMGVLVQLHRIHAKAQATAAHNTINTALTQAKRCTMLLLNMRWPLFRRQRQDRQVRTGHSGHTA